MRFFSLVVLFVVRIYHIRIFRVHNHSTSLLYEYDNIGTDEGPSWCSSALVIFTATAVQQFRMFPAIYHLLVLHTLLLYNISYIRNNTTAIRNRADCRRHSSSSSVCMIGYCLYRDRTKDALHLCRCAKLHCSTPWRVSISSDILCIIHLHIT